MPRPKLVDHVLVETPVTLTVKGGKAEAATEYRCPVCGGTWYTLPIPWQCPGAPIYQWQPWPEGMLTRKQLAAKKLNPGPLAGVIRYDKSADGDGWLRLYRESEATPKPPLSPKRQAALEKAQAAAEANRQCQHCDGSLWTRDELYSGICYVCERKEWIARDRLDAAREAYELVCRGDFVIWDSETTDLDGRFVEIAAIDANGKVLLDQRIRPGCLIASGAYAVHGIRDEDLVSAPAFAEIYPALRAVLHGKHWVIYNASFDTGVLRSEMNTSEYAAHFRRSPIEAREETCAMHLYAQWYGDWHDYYKSYRWQNLDAAARQFGVAVNAPAHSALGDCLRTLGVLYAMADYYRTERD